MIRGLAPSPWIWAAALSVSLASACVSVPVAEPIAFAVDDDQAREPSVERALHDAIETLRADPELQLLIVGHADEDNTDAYNRALSLRRAEHVRDRIVALAPELEPRLSVTARGEWDAASGPAEANDDERDKARNRRVELRYHYPSQCEPSLDAEFLACEWARLPEPPPPEPEPEPASAPPEPAPPPAEPQRVQDFRGPYVFGIGGYAISSSEYLRQHARWGVGAGYLWGFGSEFRIAAGLEFDHLVDVGFVFPQGGPCAPFCDRVDRSALRVVPELRIGGARGGLWGWLRVSAGLLMQHREATLATTPDQETIVVSEARWDPGAVFGIGPGLAISLSAHLFLLIDATVAYAWRPDIDGGGGGAGIYDTGIGLGWIF